MSDLRWSLLECTFGNSLSLGFWSCIDVDEKKCDSFTQFSVKICADDTYVLSAVIVEVFCGN